MAEITLDICTPEGKTWLAEITGIGGKYGVQRDFLHPVQRTGSRSMRTGQATYIVGDGVYESNEGRRRLGRRWWLVQDGQVQETSRELALAAYAL